MYINFISIFMYINYDNKQIYIYDLLVSVYSRVDIDLYFPTVKKIAQKSLHR